MTSSVEMGISIQSPFPSNVLCTVFPSWCIQTNTTPSESCSSKVRKLLYLLSCLPHDRHGHCSLFPATVPDVAVICLLCETWHTHARVLTSFRKWWWRISGLAWPPPSHCPPDPDVLETSTITGLPAQVILDSPSAGPLCLAPPWGAVPYLLLSEALPQQSKQLMSLDHLLRSVIIIFLLVSFSQ